MFSLGPVKEEYIGIPRLELDDANQSELFCTGSMVSKAGIERPHPLSL